MTDSTQAHGPHLARRSGMVLSRRRVLLFVLLAVASAIGIRWASRSRVDPQLVGKWTSTGAALEDTGFEVTLLADGRWERKLIASQALSQLLMTRGFDFPSVVQADVQTWGVRKEILILHSRSFLLPRNGSFISRVKAASARFPSWSSEFFQPPRMYQIQENSTGKTMLQEIRDSSRSKKLQTESVQPVTPEFDPGNPWLSPFPPERLVRWGTPRQ